MNKARSGDAHHTKKPEYWTEDKRRKFSEVSSQHYRKTETIKQCTSCSEMFWGNYKKVYCCDNCKARATRRRKGLKESPYIEFKHCANCKINELPLNHKVVSVQLLEQTTDVYDIEVEGIHNFVAEGVIVHNSHGADNYRYLAIVAEQLTNEDERSIRTPYRAPVQTVPGFGR